MKKRSAKPKTRARLEKEIARGKYVLNPNYTPDLEAQQEEEERREQISEVCRMRAVRIGGATDEYMDYFPDEFGKVVPEDGAWIIVAHPPRGTEYTVPPFSVWFAMPWQMDCGELLGEKPKRVKIQTPVGDLGLFPHEYTLAGDISRYVGRESEGVLFHKLSGEGVFPAEQLFYLQSRGIRRADACLMLLATMTAGPQFGWFEIAPQYGAYFGEDWPEPARCPFATEPERWIAENEKAAA